MKTVVITGSARGLGLELAKCFKKHDYNVVLSDINEANLLNAKEGINNITSNGLVESFVCDVTKLEDVDALFNYALDKFKAVDIWINNAGVNQAPKHAQELEEKEIDFLLNVDLKGTINGTNVALRGMNKQGFGAIYNVEGFGSNDAYQENLVIYGTAKRAVTYFSEAIARENESSGSKVIIGKLSPGIMITDFLTSANGKDKSETLSPKVKKVYNILGDYPDVIAKFLVDKMLKNKKNNKRIAWLTNKKAFKRFMLAAFNKRDFFK